jgi:hypothetical protein
MIFDVVKVLEFTQLYEFTTNPPFQANLETEDLALAKTARAAISVCPHRDSNPGFSLERAAS